MNRIPRKRINIARQVLDVRSRFPTFNVKKIKRDRIWLSGNLQPTALSKTYDVEIYYKVGFRPKVTLPKEKLDKDSPHIFKDRSLCLYHRKGMGAWSSYDYLGEKLLPMVAHWLLCFELWQITGEWYAEEYPHEPLTEKVA